MCERWIRLARPTALLLCVGALASCMGSPGGQAGSDLQSLEVYPATLALPRGQRVQYTARGIYPTGEAIPLTSRVAWSVSNETLARVEPGGTLIALRPGTVILTADDPTTGLSNRASLEVTAAVLKALVLSPVRVSKPVGVAQPFKATGRYSDGTEKELTAAVRWASKNRLVADIGTDGVARGSAPGTATLTAQDEASRVFGSAALEVTTAVLQSVSISPGSVSLPVGRSQAFTARGAYSDGSGEDLTAQVQWSSSAPAVATVNPQGLATGVAPGTAILSALEATSGFSASAQVAVSAASIKSLAVTPASAMVALQGTQAFTALGTFDDGSVWDLSSQVQWAPGDPAIASLDAHGLATGLAVGTTSLSATDPASGLSGSATLQVLLVLNAAGSLGAPALVPLGTPQPGQVDTAISYYRAAVTSGTTYQVTALGLSENVGLTVYNGDATFTNPATCLNTGFGGTQPEDCRVTATASSLYFQVDGALTGSGATFLLVVQAAAAPPSPPSAEGSAQTPVVVPLATLKDGRVDLTYSYYQAAVTQGTTYRIGLIAASDDVGLTVFDQDATFTNALTCPNAQLIGVPLPVPEDCLVKASGSVLYFKVEGIWVDPANGGASYTLLVW